MKNRRNYYRVLHLQPDAPLAVIKATYRTLMQRLKIHPDLGGDHAQAVLINEAFSVLGDPDKRAAYDRSLARDARERRTPRSAATPKEGTVRPPKPSAPRPADASVCGFCGAAVALASRDWPDGTCPSCGSALFPAKRHKAGDLSRRAIERLARNMQVTFRRAASRGDERSAMTEDVSLNGMRFLATDNITVGECLSIECPFCSAVAVVKSVQRVTSRGQVLFQVGVEFQTLRVTHARGGLVSTLA